MSKEDNVQMAGTDKSNGWFDNTKGEYIPFSEMSEAHLRNAKKHCQRKELFFHNRSMVFSELVDRLDQEAERRKLTLPDHDTEFHKNTREAKDRNRMKQKP